MDPFVAQLKEICAAHPTRAKWVFVRSHAIGRTIGDRLVIEGTNWGNLRFVTPLDIALRMGAPFLVEQGIDPSEEGLGPALMMKLLIGLPASHTYFRPLGDQPTLAAALWSTLRELRLAGVTSADIEKTSFASAAKHDEMVALVKAYESFLAAEKRGDLATVFAEAVKHPDWCPIGAADCWTEQPDVVWAPLERRLIDAMPGERVAPAAIKLPGLAPPRRLAAAKMDRRPPDPSAPLAFLTKPENVSRNSAPAEAPAKAEARPSVRSTPLFDLLAPMPEPRAPGLEPVELFHAGGAEAEIEAVFRRILDAAVTLDQCEIVCASPQYSSLVWEKAVRYDWPVTIAQGIPAALTRPGRALFALAEWIGDDFSAGRLRRLLQSGDIASDLGAGKPGVPPVTISAGRAANLLVKAQAAWGRNTYRLSLGRLAKSARTAAERSDLAPDVRDGLVDRAKQADELAAWIDALLAEIPEPGEDRTVALDRVVQAACLFVDRYAARASALDALAAQSLIDAIGDLRALGDFRCPFDQALRFIRERVESVTVGVDRPRPGHLYASSLSNAGFAGRPHVFVIGLEEGRVFPAAFEDPILLDAERAAIGADLMRSHDRTDEAVYSALVRLAAIGTADSLSYSCRDLREYRDTYASWLLLQTHRVVSGKPSATYRDLHEHLGTPESCVPDKAGALSESRWWLRGVAAAGEASRPDVFARYPGLDAGARAAAARADAAFTPFDGHVPDAGAVLDPCRTDIVVSPTQLEKAAACPFRHFVERGLGVSAIESGERDRDVWLDPLLRGSLLHDLYAQLLRRCRAAGRRVTVEHDAGWLRQRGEEMLQALEGEMPPPSEEVRERETRLFLDDLAIFVHGEAGMDASRKAIAFEVGFGRPGASAEEPLASPDPIVIDAGGVKLRVAGQIDRIDQVGPSAFEIVDYKTGGYWPDDWKGTFAGGTRLQHALYGLAALALLRTQVQKPAIRGAEYYFSSAKGQQERKRIDAQPASAVAAVLADLRHVIASGLFVHAADEKSCKWCDLGRACGQKAAARAAAKLDDPALAPFRKLTAYD